MALMDPLEEKRRRQEIEANTPANFTTPNRAGVPNVERQSADWQRARENVANMVTAKAGPKIARDEAAAAASAAAARGVSIQQARDARTELYFQKGPAKLHAPIIRERIRAGIREKLAERGDTGARPVMQSPLTKFARLHPDPTTGQVLQGKEGKRMVGVARADYAGGYDKGGTTRTIDPKTGQVVTAKRKFTGPGRTEDPNAPIPEEKRLAAYESRVETPIEGRPSGTPEAPSAGVSSAEASGQTEQALTFAPQRTPDFQGDPTARLSPQEKIVLARARQAPAYEQGIRQGKPQGGLAPQQMPASEVVGQAWDIVQRTVQRQAPAGNLDQYKEQWQMIKDSVPNSTLLSPDEERRRFLAGMPPDVAKEYSNRLDDMEAEHKLQQKVREAKFTTLATQAALGESYQGTFGKAKIGLEAGVAGATATATATAQEEAEAGTHDARAAREEDIAMRRNRGAARGGEQVAKESAADVQARQAGLVGATTRAQLDAQEQAEAAYYKDKAARIVYMSNAVRKGEAETDIELQGHFGSPQWREKEQQYRQISHELQARLQDKEAEYLKAITPQVYQDAKTGEQVSRYAVPGGTSEVPNEEYIAQIEAEREALSDQATKADEQWSDIARIKASEKTPVQAAEIEKQMAAQAKYHDRLNEMTRGQKASEVRLNKEQIQELDTLWGPTGLPKGAARHMTMMRGGAAHPYKPLPRRGVSRPKPSGAVPLPERVTPNGQIVPGGVSKDSILDRLEKREIDQDEARRLFRVNGFGDLPK